MSKVANIHYQNNKPITDSTYAAQYGLIRLGYDIVSFTTRQVDTWQSIDINKQQLYIGGIRALHKIIELSKVKKEPQVYNPNIYLPKYCSSRQFSNTTLGYIRSIIDSNKYIPVFIKPLVDDKLFTGFVLKSPIDLIKITHLSDDREILCSSVIDIQSEYRCFVFNKQLVGCKNYTGDFRVLPDFNIVEQAISDFKEQPVAYSLDFAIDKNNKTTLIEINDAIGLGYYGLNPIVYARMLESRWIEIMNSRCEITY